MIDINITPADIIKMRFAFSPMMEAVTSYHMLSKSVPYPTQYLAWIDEALRALHDVELPYMQALITTPAYIPDFLTPTPTAPSIDFEEDLKRLCATPDDIVVDHLRFMREFKGGTDLLNHAIANPREAVSALVDELRIYWNRTLEYHWSRMIAILENDILFRAREQALYGASDMINGIHHKISYDDEGLHLNKGWRPLYEDSCALEEYNYDIAGRGLHLVPVIFSLHHLYWQLGEDYIPMFIYGARGTGLWHYAEPADPEESLQIVLGTGRSRVLYALLTPRSTGELAHFLNITSGAVSQHLSKLNQAGLVESSRSGKRVFYRLSQRGKQFLDLFV